LGKSSLVFKGIFEREGGRVGHADAAATPEIFGRHRRFGALNDRTLDFIQAVQRQLAPGLAVGTAFVWRDGLPAEPTDALGLANGVPAGAAGVGDLPEKGPENQPEGPAAISGMLSLILLGEPEMADPGTEEGL